MTLNIPQIKSLAVSIYQFFRNRDNPPADRMLVAQIKADKKERNAFFATIHYAVEYCGKKEHSVRVRFLVDDQGRFRNDTWSYV